MATEMILGLRIMLAPAAVIFGILFLIKSIVPSLFFRISFLEVFIIIFLSYWVVRYHK